MEAKTVLGIFKQILGAMVGFAISLKIPAMRMLTSKTIIDATPTSGDISPSAAFLQNGLVNAVLSVWSGRIFIYKGLAL